MLLDDLTGALGGVDIGATVSGLDVAVEVDLGLPAFDADGLAAVVADLAPPELATAIATIAELADGLALDRIVTGDVLVDGAIDADALLAPLRARLELALGLVAPPLDALDGATLPELGIDGIGGRVDAVVGGLGEADLAELVTTLDGLVPGLDLRGVLDGVGPTAAGIVALLQVLAGLLAHATISRRVELDAAALRRALRGDVALAVGARLARLAGDVELVAAIRAADPDGIAMTTTVLPRVRGFVAAVLELEAVWRPALRGAARVSVGLDAEAAATQLDIASRLVASADVAAVGALATRVRGMLDGIVGLDLPDPVGGVDEAVAQALELLEGLEGVVDGVDAAGLVAPVTSVLDRATAPLFAVTGALEEVATTVTGLLRAVEDAVRAVDLSPVTTEVEQALAPVREVLGEITATIGAAEDAIAEVVGRVGSVLATIRGAIEDAAAVVRGALETVEAAIASVDFASIQAALDAGLGDVADALAAARLEPYFDAAADVIDTTADVVDAVPFDLLPTDLQQEIVDAVRPIKQLDVDGFSQDLRDELRAIVDALDTSVLDTLDAAYQQVLAFLGDLDPCVPLEEFEAGPFTALRAAVESVDPRVLLEPVEAALDEARAIVADVDLGATLLDPMRGATGAVRDTLASLAPAELLGPAVAEVDDVRAQVGAVLRLDDAEAGLDALRDGVAGLLDRLDPGTVAGLLDGAFVRALEAEPATTPGLRATVLAALTQASGLPADAGALADVVDWLGGADPAAAVRGRLERAATDADAAAIVTAELDPTPLVTAARAHRARLLDAARSHPEGSALRVEVESLLGGLDVDRTLAPVTRDHVRATADVAGTARVLAGLTPSARRELVAARDGLVDAIRPVTNVEVWVRDALARFGISDPDAPLSSLLRTLWSHVGPDRLLAPLVGLTTSMRDKAVEILDALVGPLRRTVSSVRSAVDLLDLSPVVESAETVHAEVVAAVEAIDPVVLLEPVVTDAQALLDELADFDPLAPVSALVDDLEETVTATFETLRPTVLFADACDIHAQLLDIAAGLDVRGLLEPVVVALEDLGGQLDRGLEVTAAALVALQAALPSSVSDSAVSGSVSVSIGVG